MLEDPFRDKRCKSTVKFWPLTVDAAESVASVEKDAVTVKLNVLVADPLALVAVIV